VVSIWAPCRKFRSGQLRKDTAMSLGNLTPVSNDLSAKEPLKVFGDLYRDARRAQGKTLQEISEVTRISVHFLEALEKDEIDRLPTGIFTRSFVRSYAEALNLDPSYVVDEHVKRFPESARQIFSGMSDSADVDNTFLSEQKMARTAVILFILSVPLIVLLLVFGLGSEDDNVSSETVEPNSMESVAVEQLEEIVPRAVATTAEPVSTAASNALSMETGTLAEAAVLSLDIHPTNDCWVSVTVDGGTVWSRVMRSGEREVFDVMNEATINVGDAAAFEYTLNGQAGRLLGESGEVVTFTVTPDNLASYLSE